MVFRDCSEYVYNWLTHQEHVKEESLTDWLLYNVSQQCEFIYYHTFSRHEESQNGSDWEWWIITSNKSGLYKLNAYRFLIQAKKLLSDEKDNYSLINYGNKYGTQIDLLIDFAKNVDAFPLYMFYSAGKPDFLEQKNYITYVDEDIIRLYQNCNDGCYLSLANDVYDLLYSSPRERVLDSQLLNHSISLSLLDSVFEHNIDDIERVLRIFNHEINETDVFRQNINDRYSISGIRHTEKSIPEYLSVFINNKSGNISLYDEEMKISGLGVIDLREK